MKPRGPRADGNAQAEILAAARRQFAAHGYGGATLRAIAADAGVDVALISYYHGSKSDLFLESLKLPVNPADVLRALLAGPTDDLAQRLLSQLLVVWDAPATGGPLIDVLRSATSQAELLREFIESQLLAALATAIDVPDAHLRAAAAVSQIFGLIFTRYVLRIEPLASASHADIVELIGPSLQRYFDPR
jgi:AcrR family transcriptional regulator